MTLEVTLWAIPTASLAAAAVLIVLRGWRIARECAVRNALLAHAAYAATPADPSIEEPVADEPEVAHTLIFVPRPVPLSANRRLCPVPIVVCRSGRRGELLAG